MRESIYIGRLIAVETDAGRTRTAPVAIGIDPRRGLVTAPCELAFALRDYYRRPKRGELETLSAVTYMAPQRDSYSWIHEVWGAQLAWIESLDPANPIPWIYAPCSTACGTFICEE